VLGKPRVMVGAFLASSNPPALLDIDPPGDPTSDDVFEDGPPPLPLAPPGGCGAGRFLMPPGSVAVVAVVCIYRKTLQKKNIKTLKRKKRRRDKTRVIVAVHDEDLVILACTVLIGLQNVTDGRTDGRLNYS